MERLEQILDSLSNLVWGWPLLVLLVGTHLYLTVRLRVIQRYLGTAIRLSFSRTAEGEGDVSHFGAPPSAPATSSASRRRWPRAGRAPSSGCG